MFCSRYAYWIKEKLRTKNIISRTDGSTHGRHEKTAAFLTSLTLATGLKNELKIFSQHRQTDRQLRDVNLSLSRHLVFLPAI